MFNTAASFSLHGHLQYTLLFVASFNEIEKEDLTCEIKYIVSALFHIILATGRHMLHIDVEHYTREG